jgi:phosphate transport system substrate-binding protein
VPGRLISNGGSVATILVNRWATEFSTLHPETQFDIRRGGSTSGLADLMEGRVDIVPMSRTLPADYIARFKARYGHEPTGIVVAQDAIGVYVNKDNSISGLTLAQLDAIYSGEAKRGGGRPEFWRDLGVTGDLAEERIARVCLSPAHDTYWLFRDVVMQGSDYRLDVHFELVPSSLVQAAGAGTAAIGFASVNFSTARTRFVPLQAADGGYVLPSYENVAGGHYPLGRPTLIVFGRKPDGSMNPVAREFLRFAVSRRGQRISALAVSYPITVEQQQEALRTIGSTVEHPKH